MISENKWFLIRFFLYAAFILFFVFLPLSLIDGKSFCATYNLTGILCPTCGFTRGFASLMHGDIAAAYNYNQMLVLFAVPCAFLIMIQDISVFILRLFGKKYVSFVEFLFHPKYYLSV